MFNPRIMILSLCTAAAAIAPAAALANDADVERSGTCSKNSSAKIKLSPEDGRIEAEFEVDQNRNGVTWRVVLRRNGNVAARTRATTRPPSGSFEVRRVLGNSRGRDTVLARATSPSGEVCTARATI